MREMMLRKRFQDRRLVRALTSQMHKESQVAQGFRINSRLNLTSVLPPEETSSFFLDYIQLTPERWRLCVQNIKTGESILFQQNESFILVDERMYAARYLDKPIPWTSDGACFSNAIWPYEALQMHLCPLSSTVREWFSSGGYTLGECRILRLPTTNEIILQCIHYPKASIRISRLGGRINVNRVNYRSKLIHKRCCWTEHSFSELLPSLAREFHCETTFERLESRIESIEHDPLLEIQPLPDGLRVIPWVDETSMTESPNRSVKQYFERLSIRTSWRVRRLLRSGRQ